MAKFRLTKTRVATIEEYKAQRRRIMEKTGRIARKTGLDRIQMEQLVGFDRNLNLEEVTTRELKRIISKQSEIIERTYEPLKMRRVSDEHNFLVPTAVYNQINQKIVELDQRFGVSGFGWEQVTNQHDLANFIYQLDDILGDFTSQVEAGMQYSEQYYNDYVGLLTQIARKWRYADSLLSIINNVMPEDFYFYARENGLPELFDLDTASSDEVSSFLDDMGEVLGNFLNVQPRGG